MGLLLGDDRLGGGGCLPVGPPLLLGAVVAAGFMSVKAAPELVGTCAAVSVAGRTTVFAGLALVAQEAVLVTCAGVGVVVVVSPVVASVAVVVAGRTGLDNPPLMLRGAEEFRTDSAPGRLW